MNRRKEPRELHFLVVRLTCQGHNEPRVIYYTDLPPLVFPSISLLLLLLLLLLLFPRICYIIYEKFLLPTIGKNYRIYLIGSSEIERIAFFLLEEPAN